MSKKPKVLITDGPGQYRKAYRELWWIHKIESRTRHMRHISMSGERTIIGYKRLNGEILDREKAIRGLRNDDTLS